MISSLINTINDLHRLIDTLQDEKEFVAACCSRCSQCTQRFCPIKRQTRKNGGVKDEVSASANKTIIIEFKPKSKK